MIAYYIGYISLLLPSGSAIGHFGGKWIAVIGGVGHVTLNLIAPWAARTSYWLLFASRIMMGGAEATVLPSLYYMVTRWVPDNEKRYFRSLSEKSWIAYLLISILHPHQHCNSRFKHRIFFGSYLSKPSLWSYLSTLQLVDRFLSHW